MVISALRYTFSDTDPSYDVHLSNSIIPMLTTILSDSDLDNRRLALTTFNSAAHNKPELILPHLSSLLPLAMKETVPRPELIREVQMGPFKHKVDDGLELRKSAYETLYALMETSFTRIPLPDFYDRVIAGVSDEHELKILCCLMLSKLIYLAPEETRHRLDALAEAFRGVLSFKPKDSAVKQELEKIAEHNRAVIKTSLALEKMVQETGPGGEASRGWSEYWDWIRKEQPQLVRSAEDEVRERER